MTTHRQRGILFLLAILFSLATADAALTVTQITNNSSDEKGPFRRNSFTSRGQVLFVDANDTVWLFNGTSNVEVQQKPGTDSLEPAVFMLGSSSISGQVVAAFRRGFGYGVVSVNGGTPVTTLQNPEAVSVGEGCVFMVLQTASEGNHAYRVDTSNGSVTRLSSGDVAVGALRISNSGCSKAAWTFQNDDGTLDIQYWNGFTTAAVASNISNTRRMSAGKIVYAKTVSGVEQVFAIDTNMSSSSVQLSNETDGTKLLDPQTDGRHVVWYRSNADGSAAQLVLNGGVVFPTGELQKVDNVEYPFQLDRGQLLWRNPAGTHFYDDGTTTQPIDPSPATSFTNPWLSDGTIAFRGTGGADPATDIEVFRITGTSPADLEQPSPPLLVTVTPGNSEITVHWDRVLGATAYNLYLANEPGVTKDNYGVLAGGRRITGVTSPYTLAVSPNNVYYAAVSVVEGPTEGPSSSRTASSTVVGDLSWQSVGGLGGTTFYSIAADQANASFAYAGANGSVYRSTDGGLNWSEVLAGTTTGGSRVASLAVGGGRVFANIMSQADIWRSTDNGSFWTRVLEVSGFGELSGSLAIAPGDSNRIYAGDFILEGKTFDQSLVIKSTDGGGAWSHTAEASDELHAYALAVHPTDPLIVYAGGAGTPNVAYSTNGGDLWTDLNISGGGQIYGLTIDPQNPSILYAASLFNGVYKSVDGGASWTAKNGGLTGVDGDGQPAGEFHAILVDPSDSNYLHLGAGNGYWYSLNGGESWTQRNSGFGLDGEYIYGLALTPSRRLLAATYAGLYLLSVAPPPVVQSVSPNSGSITGGTAVTITGTGFQAGASVTFGGTSATNVSVISSTSITATTPARSAGTVDVTVTNFDTESGSLAGGFTYTNTAPPAPTGVSATAQTTTSVLVTWTAADSATSYQVWRRAPGGSFQPLGISSDTSFTDSPVSASTSYLYLVKAVNSVGTSPDSTSDLATTVIFPNEPLSSGVTILAAHLSKLREGTNAVRGLASLGPASFTGSASAGTLIRAVHITEIRTALDEARNQLGLSTGGYTDTSLAGVVAKAVHHQELRNRIK